MKLLLDQGLPRRAASLLRATGWEVFHVGEIGMARASDREILAEAVRRDGVIVSLDADFHALLAVSGATRPSVIRLRLQGVDAQSLVELLMRLRPELEEAMRAGVLVTIDKRTARIRRLPIAASG